MRTRFGDNSGGVTLRRKVGFVVGVVLVVVVCFGRVADGGFVGRKDGRESGIDGGEGRGFILNGGEVVSWGDGGRIDVGNVDVRLLEQPIKTGKFHGLKSFLSSSFRKMMMGGRGKKKMETGEKGLAVKGGNVKGRNVKVAKTTSVPLGRIIRRMKRAVRKHRRFIKRGRRRLLKRNRKLLGRRSVKIHTGAGSLDAEYDDEDEEDDDIWEDDDGGSKDRDSLRRDPVRQPSMNRVSSEETRSSRYSRENADNRRVVDRADSEDTKRNSKRNSRDDREHEQGTKDAEDWYARQAGKVGSIEREAARPVSRKSEYSGHREDMYNRSAKQGPYEDTESGRESEYSGSTKRTSSSYRTSRTSEAREEYERKSPYLKSPNDRASNEDSYGSSQGFSGTVKRLRDSLNPFSRERPRRSERVEENGRGIKYDRNSERQDVDEEAPEHVENERPELEEHSVRESVRDETGEKPYRRHGERTRSREEESDDSYLHPERYARKEEPYAGVESTPDIAYPTDRVNEQVAIGKQMAVPSGNALPQKTAEAITLDDLPTEPKAYDTSKDNITHLAMMTFKIAKEIKGKTMVAMPCRPTLSWLPKVVAKLQFILPAFKFYCVDTDTATTSVEDLKKAFEKDGDAETEFLKISPKESEDIPPNADLVLSWMGMQDWGVKKSWRFVKGLRESGAKRIMFVNNPRCMNTNSESGEINLRKQPFHFGEPLRVIKNISLVRTKPKDVLLYHMDEIRNGF